MAGRLTSPFLHHILDQFNQGLIDWREVGIHLGVSRAHAYRLRTRWLRARWKIENANNNVLKNRGYHLEHNFGHGKQHLSSLLATLNLLALGLHTLLELLDEGYRLVRRQVGPRRTFFQHVQPLTTYWLFASWEKLLDFMLQGLEIGPYAIAKS